MSKVTVDVETLKWAAESVANEALDRRDRDGARVAVRLHDALKAAGQGTVVTLVIDDLKRLAG
jgi:hypothetical protein